MTSIRCRHRPGRAESAPDEEPTTAPHSRRRELSILLAVTWLALAGVGVTALVRYRPTSGPGDVLRPPAEADRFVVYVNEDDWVRIALLPRIGETLARRIVALRRREGPYRGPEDLTRVRGIGRRTVDYLRPYIRFERRKDQPAGSRPVPRRRSLP